MYKNPNGYGGITKLSGRRRRPFVVRKTIGYDDNAHPIYKVIGYYPTRSAAITALSEYNHDPYDIDLSKATMADIYKLWSKDADLKQNMRYSYAAAFKHCSDLHDCTYKTIKKAQMQKCIDECGRGYSTRSNIKSLFSQLDKFAFDNDIITKCYSSNLDTGEKEQSEKHTPFTDEEVMSLWDYRNIPYVDETLFMLYSGARVSEMLRITTDNVHLEDGYIVGGMKTSNGKDRTIPIHPDILSVVKSHYNENNKFLFQFKDTQATTSFTNSYLQRWKEQMELIGIHHLTHDCRHTVRSKLDSANANKVAIDKIMGHSSSTIGEKVYTHKTLDELKETMALLNYGPVHS